MTRSPHQPSGQDPSADTGEDLLRAETLAHRLDKPMGVLGIVFLFVVLGQLLATEPVLSAVLAVAGWLFWAVFVAEFLLRAYIARFRPAFWKRNWWQVIFLLVPFLRFLRALQSLRLLRVLRVARFGSILSAGVRGSRSAGRLLSSRIGWLIAITAVVILAASQLLFVSGDYDSYGHALYVSSMATITGSGITAASVFARILQVALAIYSVGIFATLAASLGAFFLRDSVPQRVEEPPRA
ncbi:MAG: hypothetical protein WED09_04460 [Homoserinimonas sp.]